MRKILISTYTLACLTSAVLLFNSCHKKQDAAPLVIIPTVNPIPYSIMVYLITPTDQSFNPQYYTGAKDCILNLQNWYKTQMGNNKTFILNPVVVDTLTGLHSTAWYTSNNGDSISGSGNLYAYYNIKYELPHLLGNKYDSVHNTYYAFVPAPFTDETIPKGLGVEGLDNLQTISGKFPDFGRGDAGHAIGHAFGLNDYPQSATSIMGQGYVNYPNCVLLQFQIDSLNATPFFKVQ